MESVSVRELKNRLGYYLRNVRQGSSLVVTARGRPVARLIPISPPARTALPPQLEQRMWELAAKGFLTWAGRPFRVPQPVGVNRGSVLLSDLVVEDRE